MTTPQRPADPPLPVEPGWDDERLAAAFAARAARVVVPVDLVAATTDRLRPAATARPWWRRLLPAGAIAVLLVAVIGGGIALLGGPTGLLGGASGVSFRDGPTTDLRTLDAGTFALDFPADWHGYDATGPYQGTAMAVLSSRPIPCGSGDRIDITCVYERPLEPGEARILVGVLSYRSGTILDRPSTIVNGTTSRLSLGGMPAILDERDQAPDDFYRADDTATWSIGTPESLSRAVQLDFQAREPEVDAARGAAEAIAESFRFTPPPTPLPDDPAAAVAAARAMLDAEADSFRRGFVPAGDSDGQTYLDCLPEAPGEDRVVGIDYGPGGDLGWTVLTRCRWTVVTDEHGPFWRIDTVYEWTVGEQFGRYRESLWIDATGLVVARSNSGEVPPAGDPSATPAPPATSAPSPTAPAWGPWPPDGAEVIELPNDDPNEPALVAVVDRSGALTEVRAPTAQDGQPEGPDEAFFRDPSGDGRYRLRWGTTICDREMTVTIDAEVDHIVIDHAPRDGCDAMGIGREIVLEFSRDIDPASVDLIVNRAVLLPQETVSSAPDVPAEVFGLDVIDVEEARAIQARPDDDREIAVRGWIWRMNPATIDCLVLERTDVEDLFFGEGCRSDSLLATADGTFDDAVVPLAIGQASSAALPFDTRVEVILIGHFDDRRSSACTVPLVARCTEMFWVDVAWIDGAAVDRDWTIGTVGSDALDRPLGTADDAAAAARSLLDDDPTRTMPHDGEVLSVGLLPGDQLATLEPTMRSSCGPSCDALFQAPVWVWHVTVLDRTLAEARTFVINDDGFDGRRSIIVREATTAGVVERETMVTSAEGPEIVLGLGAEGLPVPIEEVELPMQVP